MTDGEFGERAGAIRQIDADAHEAAVLDQAAFDDAAQKRDVDIAAADDHGGVLAVQRGLVLQQGRDARGAGAFGEHFFAFEQREDGAGDLFFLDGNDLVDIFRDQRKGDVAGAADGDAVGDRWKPLGMVTGVMLLASAAAWKARRAVSTPTIFTSGRNSLMAQATPAINPPPPTGTTTASNCGHCSSNSRPMVPCPAMTAMSSKACRNVMAAARGQASERARRPRRNWRRRGSRCAP